VKSDSIGTVDATQSVSMGLSEGMNYSIYTITFRDSDDNPVPAFFNDIIRITDDSQILPNNAGAMKYFIYDNYNHNQLLDIGSSTGGIAANIVIPSIFTNEKVQYKFAVANTIVGSVNPINITVVDDVLGIIKTIPYTYTAGPAVRVKQEYPITLSPGETNIIRAQLTDEYGNEVAKADTSVYAWFQTDNTLSGVTLGDTNSTSGIVGIIPDGAYLAGTDNQGVAMIPIKAAENALEGNFSINIAISSQGPACTVPLLLPGKVVSVTQAVHNLVLYDDVTSIGTLVDLDKVVEVPSAITLSAGAVLDSSSFILGGATLPLRIVGENLNGLIEAGGQDCILITSSDPNVVSVNGHGNTSIFLDNSTGAVFMPSLMGGKVGNATITITDMSAVSRPSLTLNINVVPSVATSAIGSVQLNGAPIMPNNPLIVAKNTPVLLEISNIDIMGNSVVVTADQVFNLLDTNGGSFSLSPNGATITNVSIPVNESSVEVYYMNETTGIYTQGLSAVRALVVNPIEIIAVAAWNPILGMVKVTVNDSTLVKKAFDGETELEILVEDATHVLVFSDTAPTALTLAGADGVKVSLLS
jgi:hypothetical protein